MVPLRNIYINIKKQKKIYKYMIFVSIIFANISFPFNYNNHIINNNNNNNIAYASEAWNPYTDGCDGSNCDIDGKKSTSYMDKTIAQEREEAAKKKAAEKASDKSAKTPVDNFTGPNNPKNFTNAGKNGASNSGDNDNSSDQKENPMTTISDEINNIKNTEVKGLGDGNAVEDLSDIDIASAKDKCTKLVAKEYEKNCEDESKMKLYASCLKTYNDESACAFILDGETNDNNKKEFGQDLLDAINKYLPEGLQYDNLLDLGLDAASILLMFTGVGAALKGVQLLMKLNKVGKLKNLFAIITKAKKAKNAEEAVEGAEKLSTMEKIAKEAETAESKFTKIYNEASKGLSSAEKVTDVNTKVFKEGTKYTRYFKGGLKESEASAIKNTITSSKNAVADIEKAGEKVSKAEKTLTNAKGAKNIKKATDELKYANKELDAAEKTFYDNSSEFAKSLEKINAKLDKQISTAEHYKSAVEIAKSKGTIALATGTIGHEVANKNSILSSSKSNGQNATTVKNSYEKQKEISQKYYNKQIQDVGKESLKVGSSLTVSKEDKDKVQNAVAEKQNEIKNKQAKEDETIDKKMKNELEKGQNKESFIDYMHNKK